MKEKRKTRLNKTQGTKTEFLGFGAFADSTNSHESSPELRWSPVYTGKVEALCLLFPRLLKKDTTTRTKALQELQDFFQDDSLPKKQQADALAHFFFLYHSKIVYDAASSVRAEGLAVLALAAARVPKAFSTLAQHNNHQVLGMMYCCHGDPAAEVRAAANKHLPENSCPAYSLTDMQGGIWEYVERILSYGRASKMQEELFASSLKGSTKSVPKGNTTENGNSTELSEAQKDQSEELFERLVGTAMSGLQVWVQQHGLIEQGDAGLSQKITTQTTPSVLWKTLSSSKSSLRSRTYVLLSTCCQKAPAFIFDAANSNGFSQTLPQALASEKEPGNMASLLEALLSYLAAHSKHTGISAWETSLNAATVAKHLIKIFKKSCYGAAATQWGPSLLPLLAMLPSEQFEVLTAVWIGRDHAIRSGDRMAIVTTVSESAAYFLVRKGNEEEGSDMTQAKQIAELWLECLNSFLGLEPPKAAVRNTQLQLGKALARELQQLEKACYDRPSCAIYAVKDWFWQEKLRFCVMQAGPAALATIVQALTPPSSGASYLSSILREKFNTVVSTFQNRSGDVPTLEAYELMIATLRFVGVDDQGDEAEKECLSWNKFLMNDVLRWMVVHTSSLSEQKQTEELAQKDFQLFGICAASLSAEKREKQWEIILREIIAAKCRLRLLLAGLKALLESGIPVEQIQCDMLDDFAIQVVKDAMATREPLSRSDHESHEGELSDDNELEAFLQTCTGLKSYPSLVRQSVISAWVDQACPSVNTDDPEVLRLVPGPILNTLLLLSSAPSPLANGQIHRVSVQSWCQGGRVWDTLGEMLLLNEPDHLPSMMDQSSKFLRAVLVDKSAKSGDPDASKQVQLWSDMASRLLHLRKRAPTNVVNATQTPLELVVLGDVSLWEETSSHDFLFCCLMRILHEITDPSERLEQLHSSEDPDAIPFIVKLFLITSEAKANEIGAARAAQRKDRCAQLLSVLGGRNMLRGKTAEVWLRATISQIKHFIEAEDMDSVCRGVAVVSQLCDLMMDRANQSDVFSPDEDGEDVSDEFERERIARIIAPAIPKETFASLRWNSCLAELVNVIFSQCGVGPERGIGSLHFDMLQLVLAAVGRLRAHLSNPDGGREEDMVQELMLISLSCGFGLTTPRADSDLHMITFDADQITASLLDYHDTQSSEGEGVAALTRAVSIWLVTSIDALKDGELRNRALMGLYKGAISVFRSTCGNDKDTLLALRSVDVALNASRKCGSIVPDVGVQAVMRIMEAFCEKWEHSVEQQGVLGQDFDENCNEAKGKEPAWRSLSHFPTIVSYMVTHDGGLLKASCSDLVDGLVLALFVPEKRWYAFRLLEAIARSTEMLHDATPEEATAARLAEWTANMDADEKGELQEDVELSCEVLPHMLMTETESWSDEEYADSVDDKIIIGRMLAWLCCLSFVDAFVRKDSSYRPSLCSYIGKSFAADAILNLTLLHTGVGTERTNQKDSTIDMDSLLGMEQTVNEVNLASLVLFRTVEALPTLSRKWWESECPKVFIDPFLNYVETQIAPVILKCELERLKLATIKNAFGAMTVTGSATTREINAIYVQDEIKLKVQIRLPSNFPLRNAEVDCSQTLGVSSKRWKLWSLQITMMLNNQGGTLQEALMLWKENVDKEFDGVEPCPVCYSVLHIKSHKLPELQCTTCSNCFHSLCLTQWFKSSGKTQCVICQQPWSGTRVKK